MSPVRIGIDHTQSPLLVAGQIVGKYTIGKGSKGVNLVGIYALSEEEVLEIFKDVHSVVKYTFDASNYESAVVVVPSSTTKEIREELIFFGQNVNFDMQVVDHHTAVAVGYTEKVKPTVRTKISIISLYDGVLEVSIVSCKPSDGTDEREPYKYALYDHKCIEKIDIHDHKDRGGQSSGGISGFMGDTFKALVVDPFEAVTGILVNLFANLKKDDGDKVEKVVLVGEAARSDKLRHAALERFHGAEVWPGKDEADEVAAYGAAAISYRNVPVTMGSSFDYEAKVDNKYIDESKSDEDSEDGIGMFHFG